jgi:outer membrane usher protein
MAQKRLILALMMGGICGPALATAPTIDGYTPGAEVAQAASVDVSAVISDGFSELGQDTPLFLFAIVNGNETGLVAEFTAHPGENRLSSTRSELAQIGIKAAAGLGKRVYLDDIPGLSFNYQADGQKIFIEAPFQALEPSVISAANAPAFEEPDRSFGGVLNYSIATDLSAVDGLSGLTMNSISAALEARVFSPYGTLNSTGLYRYSHGAANPTSFVRHETSFEVADTKRALTYTFGDLTNSGLQWSRPIRMGGFQVRRDFSLRSDLVKDQLLTFSGAAAVPSTVDVFIDNNRAYSANVDSGPFRIEDLPLHTGAGDATIVVRDEQGREKRRRVSFFTARNLIKPGMADYALEVGYAREDFGARSNSYGDDLIVSGSLRYGLSDKITLEGHFESTDGLTLLGMGANFVPFSLGEVSMTAGASQYNDVTAGFVHATLRTTVAGVDLNASTLRSQDGFADLASVTGIDLIAAGASPLLETPKALDVISLSMPLARTGSKLGINYVHSERATSTDRIVSVSVGHRLKRGRGALSLSGSRNFDTDDKQLSLNLSMPLGNRTHARAGVGRDQTGAQTASVYIAKPLGEDVGDIGYAGQLEQRGSTFLAGGRGDYRGRYGKAGADIKLSDSTTYIRGDIEGSLVYTGGRFAAGNTVSDGFAIVDVGVGDVPVYLQNRPVTRTNRNGIAVITGAASHQRSRVSINVNDLPADTSVGVTAVDIVPARNAGQLVSFDGNDTPSVLAVLRDASGAVLPTGAAAFLNGSDEEFIVGYDGVVWLEDVKRSNTVKVRYQGQSCTARFDYRATAAMQDMIDPVTCK